MKRAWMLFFAILLSVGFPCGIVMIVIGAKSDTFTLVSGIVLTVAGFYVMPMLWVAYGNTAKYAKIAKVVEKNNIYNISDLSQQIGVKSENGLEIVREAIARGYLTGYRVKNNNELELIDNVKQLKTDYKTVKCSACGATYSYKRTDKNAVCPYCGTHNE